MYCLHVGTLIVVVWQKTYGTTRLCIFLPLLFMVFILYNSHLTFSLCFLISSADPYPVYPLYIFLLSAFPMLCPLYCHVVFIAQITSSSLVLIFCLVFLNILDKRWLLQGNLKFIVLSIKLKYFKCAVFCR